MCHTDLVIKKIKKILILFCFFFATKIVYCNYVEAAFVTEKHIIAVDQI